MQTVTLILATLLGTLAVVLIAGVVYQITGTRRDRNRARTTWDPTEERER
jgi:hypothetical protein